MKNVWKICLVALSFGLASIAGAAPNPGQAASSEAAKPSPSSVATQVNEANKVNLNTADAKTIANAMNGIGAKRARAIVAYREKNGVFTTIEDLAKVKGISLKFVKNRLAELQEKFTIG